jgi:MFS family permease
LVQNEAALRHPVLLVRSDAASCLERVFSLSGVGYPRHGHSAADSGLVIGIHIGAMYLSSLLTGWLVDRYGHMKIAAASGITLLVGLGQVGWGGACLCGPVWR